MLKCTHFCKSYSLRFIIHEKLQVKHYLTSNAGYAFGINTFSIRHKSTKNNDTYEKEKKVNYNSSECETGSSINESFNIQSKSSDLQERHIDIQNKTDSIEDIDFSRFFEKYSIPSDHLQLNHEKSDIKIVPAGEILQNLHESYFKDSYVPDTKKQGLNQNKGTKDNGDQKNISFSSKKYCNYPNSNASKKKLNKYNKIKSENVSMPVLKKSSVKKIILPKNKNKKKYSDIIEVNKRDSEDDLSVIHAKNNHSKMSSLSAKEELTIKKGESSHLESNITQSSLYRQSPLNIQMLSKNLHSQIFGKLKKNKSQLQEESDDLSRSIEHLTKQGLWGKEPSLIPDVELKVPTLKSSNLDQHFKIIAEDQCGPYKELLHEIVSVDLPTLPQDWSYTPGWTRYNPDGTTTEVDFPDCQALVFDVEVCVLEGPQPTLAAAVSNKFWYSWCSLELIDPEKWCSSSDVKLNHLIPLETNIETGNCDNAPRVIVGHNVSYDRLRVREQYLLQGTHLRFVDTMSLHIAVSGLVQEQRALFLKNKTNNVNMKLPWMFVGCQNNLNDVYKFYCRKEEGLKKETRNVFVTGSLNDIRNDFQRLMTYCADDVKATHDVLVKLLPMFFKRFPHPVTFSGMLEMGSTILPVTDNWTKYIKASESDYHQLEQSLNEELVTQAQKALSYLDDKEYENDLWLWCLDWNLPSKRVKILKDYPNWYRKLCARTGQREGTPEPENMSTSLQIVPRLLNLTWDGYPLHYVREHGWGYLKPVYSSLEKIPNYKQNDPELSKSSSEEKLPVFPIKTLYDMCCSLDPDSYKTETNEKDVLSDDEEWEQLLFSNNDNDAEIFKKSKKSIKSRKSSEQGVNIGIPGVTFFPLPHKNGPGNRVGNPLAKDFLGKIENKTLSSHIGNIAELVLKTTKTLSYWRNNRDRILSQNVVWSEPSTLPNFVMTNKDFNSDKQYGVILPQVVSAGTITRRAVERTWMTASNAYEDRIGSELKAMVEAPAGYSFVGADVDSQELWIAAVLGDAYFAGQHGATALGWMTLQGKKSDGTDMHSRTAQTAGISRDNAKVINYGRIYGAGLKFMERLLKQFNPNLSDDDIKQRAIELFATTKGQKGWLLNSRGEHLAHEIGYEYTGLPLQRKEINSIVRNARKINEDASFYEIVEGMPLWVGGSESHMFNCLEAIARSEEPKTPVLGARITRALEPDVVDDQFMTSRVNWVVQSSAVDYLHLMLVSMNWLFKEYNITGRFCISIHDEVRYLVKYEDRYRAALALQITNLLTRSLFALKLGIHDLPQSVAFFSGVDIDQVLRKEPHLDCKTPSNPSGLNEGYGIPPGETLDIGKIIEITQGNLNSYES
ncbi:unnamed protein product, partial [Meganyctiphanes norvegica]